LGGWFPLLDFNRATWSVQSSFLTAVFLGKSSKLPAKIHKPAILGWCHRAGSRRYTHMTEDRSPKLAELDERIAIVRDNIRELVEQAAAFSGAEDEERNADRIAQQQAELERLLLQRDQLVAK
jgi:hypothetical protein